MFQNKNNSLRMISDRITLNVTFAMLFQSVERATCAYFAKIMISVKNAKKNIHTITHFSRLCTLSKLPSAFMLKFLSSLHLKKLK
jgi:hypothetical protein